MYKHGLVLACFQELVVWREFETFLRLLCTWLSWSACWKWSEKS